MNMFKAYQQAINKIDDYFEYRYTAHNPDQIKEFVMGVIDELAEELEKPPVPIDQIPPVQGEPINSDPQDGLDYD